MTIVVVLLTISCNAQQARDYNAIGRIPRENRQERLALFSSYSVDRQIDLYLFAQNFVEGTNEDYMDLLAHDGEMKVSAIADRIDATSRFGFKTDLILALDLYRPTL